MFHFIHQSTQRFEENFALLCAYQLLKHFFRSLRYRPLALRINKSCENCIQNLRESLRLHLDQLLQHLPCELINLRRLFFCALQYTLHYFFEKVLPRGVINLDLVVQFLKCL